jgi:tetraacyldisaccharide 4'-kinase
VYRRRVLAPLRTTVARWLEGGSLSIPLTRAIARAHGAIASRAVERPLRIPAGSDGRPRVITVTVGGATLGGSGKTRVAVACARELAAHGSAVVLIGHAYRASIARACVVVPDDALAHVGDEALVCARALAGVARVVVGPTRQAAMDLAMSLRAGVDAVVLDGPLQLTPVKASLAVLAVDAHAPWGARALPPAGDLRAPREALLAAADYVVEVDATPAAAHLASGRTLELAAFAASRAGLRLGLFTALGRPARLERALVAVGLCPAVVIRAPDHGPLTAALARTMAQAPVDLWLATEKCALHLEPLRPSLPVAILDGRVDLPPSLTRALLRASERSVDGVA